MTEGSLIKAGSGEAEFRVRRLRHAPAPRGFENEQPIPSVHELEIERLQLKVAELEALNHTIDQQWRDTFDFKLNESAQNIIKEHRDDDARRIGLLETALIDANTKLEKILLASAKEAGLALARYALSRFATERAADTEWLAEIVTRQIKRVGDAMIIAIRVNSAEIQAANFQNDVAAGLAGRCEIIPDVTIPLGSVRLQLRLGHIDIDPSSALNKIIEALANHENVHDA